MKVNRGVIVVLGAGTFGNNMLKGFLETLDFTTQILNIRDRDGGPDKYEAELKSARLIVVNPPMSNGQISMTKAIVLSGTQSRRQSSLSLPKSLLTTLGAGRVLNNTDFSDGNIIVDEPSDPVFEGTGIAKDAQFKVTNNGSLYRAYSSLNVSQPMQPSLLAVGISALRDVILNT